MNTRFGGPVVLCLSVAHELEAEFTIRVFKGVLKDFRHIFARGYLPTPARALPP
jgi:hypothetical protein